MSKIHPTAIVDAGAEIAADVEVGPYAVIGPHVHIGSGTTVGPHAVITGHTRIGRNNTIYQFVSLGAAPQDKKYRGEDTRLEIGDNNTIREFCTLNVGTAQDAGVTRLGDDNWIMAYVHMAHDCQIGSHTIFANGVQLAGHVHVGDWVILGGCSLLHQFTRVGAHAMTGMGSAVSQDVPPYVLVTGNLAAPRGINSEGLKRRGFSPEAIGAIRRAYKTLYRDGLSFDEAKAQINQRVNEHPELGLLADFLNQPGRGIVR